MTSNEEMIKLINSVFEELHNPKDVNMFYARYWANHVGGIYETVEEAIRAWHKDDLQTARR